MPHPYKILNLQGYFSCKTIEKISRLRRENFLNWGEGQLPLPSKIWNDATACSVFLGPLAFIISFWQSSWVYYGKISFYLILR